MLAIAHLRMDTDPWGHIAGAQLFAAVARGLAGQLRPYDIASRFGGEEFAVLLPDTTEATACLVAERLRSCVSATSPLPGSTLRVTVSIGLAVATPVREDHRALVAAADAPMYHANR